ncbi:MAG: hypothetical protein HY904_01785 [Deltaproteobacteria bacterium]|nr:hypothetical protein [Deltaproteobacteria bacterium]
MSRRAAVLLMIGVALAGAPVRAQDGGEDAGTTADASSTDGAAAGDAGCGSVTVLGHCGDSTHLVTCSGTTLQVTDCVAVYGPLFACVAGAGAAGCQLTEADAGPPGPPADAGLANADGGADGGSADGCGCLRPANGTPAGTALAGLVLLARWRPRRRART